MWYVYLARLVGTHIWTCHTLSPLPHPHHSANCPTISTYSHPLPLSPAYPATYSLVGMYCPTVPHAALHCPYCLPLRHCAHPWAHRHSLPCAILVPYCLLASLPCVSVYLCSFYCAILLCLFLGVSGTIGTGFVPSVYSIVYLPSVSGTMFIVFHPICPIFALKPNIVR